MSAELTKRIEQLEREVSGYQAEILELGKEILKKDQQIVKSESKAVSLRDQNELAQYDPKLFRMQKQIEIFTDIAVKLISSKAFPNVTPEQAFVLIKAGDEMGLQPMESLHDLYIVNGRVSYWGAGLLKQLTSKGITFEYENETNDGVTVIAFQEGKEHRELVTKGMPVFTNSKAFKIDPRNKMRHHGIKMIANFKFPHLLGNASVWDEDDMRSIADIQDDHVEKIMTLPIDELDAYFEANKKEITRNIRATEAIVKRRREIAEITGA